MALVLEVADSHTVFLTRLRLSFVRCAGLVLLAWGVSCLISWLVGSRGAAVQAGFFAGNVRVIVAKGGLKEWRSGLKGVRSGGFDFRRRRWMEIEICR